jgi:hypothetical protein
MGLLDRLMNRDAVLIDGEVKRRPVSARPADTAGFTSEPVAFPPL